MYCFGNKSVFKSIDWPPIIAFDLLNVSMLDERCGIKTLNKQKHLTLTPKCENVVQLCSRNRNRLAVLTWITRMRPWEVNGSSWSMQWVTGVSYGESGFASVTILAHLFCNTQKPHKQEITLQKTPPVENNRALQILQNYFSTIISFKPILNKFR